MSYPMASFDLDYTCSDKDARGNVRYYVRIKVNEKYKKKRLKETPGTRAFLDEYEAALAELRGVEPAPSPISTESLRWLIQQYYNSGEFFQLAPATQQDKKSTLNRVCLKAGAMPYDEISHTHILKGRDDRRETPAAANKFIKHMRGLFKWAKDRGFVSADPTRDVENLKIPRKDDGTTGWYTWKPQDIEQFRSAHAIGTMPRLAFELHYIGARASDVIRLGHQHVQGNKISWIQKKTGQRTTQVLTPELKACIDAAPRDRLHFIVNRHGRPVGKSYMSMFQRWRRAAGLPDKCTSHGIRKAMAVELVERGASELETAAALGQSGTQSVKHYTVAARRDTLAEKAAKRRTK